MRVGIDISFLNTLKEKQGVNRYALGFIREITTLLKPLIETTMETS